MATRKTGPAVKNTSKKTLYVVTATEFGYNDQTYFVEGDGGMPLNAFFTKKEAEAFITKETVKWIRDMGSDNLSNHGESINEIFDEAPAFLSKEEKKNLFDEDGSYCPFDRMEVLKLEERSDEELAQVAKVLTFRPFTLHKISVE
jgi:hypothetical protein